MNIHRCDHDLCSFNDILTYEFKGSGFKVQGSGLAPRACRPMITCERGSEGSIGSRGSKGLVRRKHNEAPQIFDSVSRRRHQKRWREISMAHYGKYHRIGTGREPTPWC